MAEASTRERLLDSAAELMHARGYEAVGVAELCVHADARKGSFYHWWPSKRDLALAMLDRAWENYRHHVLDVAFGADDSVLAGLDRYGTLLCEQQRAMAATGADAGAGVRGCRLGNFALELSTRDRVVRDRVETHLTAMADYLAAVLRRAAARGEVPALDGDGATTAAESVVAHMEGLMLLAKVRDDPTLLRRLGADARRLLGVAPS